MGYDYPCIGMAYVYCDINGITLLHKGIDAKPRSKKIQGYNVQITESDTKQKQISPILEW